MANQRGSAAMAATLAIVGVVVGAAVAYPIGHSSAKNSSTNNSASTATMASADTDGVTVGGAKMVRTKDIVDNAVNAKNVTTVVAAVKAAGLVDTLKGEGPFTVFAPDNDAFNKLPKGTVDTLLKPENKDQLTQILTYHVVPGTYTSADLKVMAEKGQALTTVQGETIMPVMENNKVMLKDTKGDMVGLVTADVISSNGVTHVIDSVLMP